MDSLLASYGSDSDEEQAPAPPISGKPIFSSPPARNRAIEDLDDIPSAGGGLFSSLPAPKSQSTERKKVVQFRPPIDFSVLEEEEEVNKKKTKAGSKGEPEKVLLGDFALPAPKNKSLGVALGAGRRVDAGCLELEEEPGSAAGYGGELTQDGSYGAQQVDDQYYGAEYSQQVGAYGAQSGAAESYGTEYAQAYEGYAAQYSQQAGAEYPQQQAGAEYSEEPDSSEIYLETRSYGAREFPQSDGAPREFKQERKRKGRDEPVKFVEIKQADLTKNRPREDQFRMTGIAFGAPFEKRDDEENKPTRLHKRKHQIGSLYYDMRQKEFELMERRARGQQSKSQTMAKYGW